MPGAPVSGRRRANMLLIHRGMIVIKETRRRPPPWHRWIRHEPPEWPREVPTNSVNILSQSHSISSRYSMFAPTLTTRIYVGTHPVSHSLTVVSRQSPPGPGRRPALCAGNHARQGAGVARSQGPRQERPPGDGGRRPWVSPRVVSIREYTYRTHYACGTRHLSAGRALKGSRVGQR